MNDLREFGEGLIVTAGCIQGLVSQHLLANDFEGAKRVVDEFANSFPGRYYLEIQRHSTPDQARITEMTIRLAREVGVPLVASNDVHFLHPGDHHAHHVLTCVGHGKPLQGPDAEESFYAPELHFAAPEEMRARFADVPEAITNTLAIADAVDLVLDKKHFMPRYPLASLPADTRTAAEREHAEIERLVRIGATQRYGDPLPAAVEERIRRELDVIVTAGFAGYHLIVQDFINWAKREGIAVGPGRGSAAGSIVCYCLGITKVDPLKYDLLFERYLNPERVSLPDIDVDFAPSGRERIIEYIKSRYGRESVAQVAAFGTMKARAAIRAVARSLNRSIAEQNRIAELVPNAPGSAMTIAEARVKVPELVEACQDPDIANWLDQAALIEGTVNTVTRHAAAVVISPGPLTDYISLGLFKDTKTGNMVVTAAGDGPTVERAGLIKMDILGLKTLDVIGAIDRIDAEGDASGAELTADTEAARESLQAIGGTVEQIRRMPGHEHFSADDIPDNDPAPFAMLRAGAGAGVFQLEKGYVTDILREMHADCFNDLVAATALLRPGPLDAGTHRQYIARKTGAEPVSYPHPLLEPVLRDTYGIIVYQEQVMKAVQVLAGYSLGEADLVRKAVGKKDAALIQSTLREFVQRAVDRGTCTEQEAERVASLIETFGRYGFNKSHSVAYSIVSYQTAYLKAHYPAFFMASLLSHYGGVLDGQTSSKQRMPVFLREARDLQIRLLPPSVNVSGLGFTAAPDGERVIRLGLKSIKKLSGKAAQAIIHERARSGPFASIEDFCRRIMWAPDKVANRGDLQVLIRAGALDGLGATRRAMLEQVDRLLKAPKVKANPAAQTALFADILPATTEPAGLITDMPEFSSDELGRLEHELTGLFLSGHPVDGVEALARATSTHEVADLVEVTTSTRVPATFVGVLTQIKRETSKKSGKPYGRAILEDRTGTIDVLLSGRTLQEFDEHLQVGAVVAMAGAVEIREAFDNRGDDEDDVADGRLQSTLMPDRIWDCQQVAGQDALHLELALVGENRTPAQLQVIGQLLKGSPGPARVFVHDGDPEHLQERQTRVTITPALIQGLVDALGAAAVRVRVSQPERRTASPWQRRGGGVPA
jgi:DNA polymerase-3 subunit alpha